MRKIQEQLQAWRIERNMDNNEFIVNIEVANLLEECAEFFRAKNDYERIDAICDISVFSINAIFYIEKENNTFEIENIYDASEYRYSNIYDVLRAIGIFNNNNTNIEKTAIFRIIIKTCYTLVTEMGYDYKKCMLETIKEINSRNQDETQKIEWTKNGVSGKWQKDKNQDKSTLYKADYEKCKIQRQ